MQRPDSTPAATKRVSRNPHIPAADPDTKMTKIDAPTACDRCATAPPDVHAYRQCGTSVRPRTRLNGRDEIVTAAGERPDHRPDRLHRSGTCAGWWGTCGIFLEGRGCAVAGGAWAAHGQRGGLGGAHLGLRCRACRSERSSEPGCGGGTHPQDGQGLALSSARPLRPPGHAQNVPKMRIASPVRAQARVSRQTLAHTTPHRARIAGICGARWGVLVSTRNIPGSLNGRGAKVVAMKI